MLFLSASVMSSVVLLAAVPVGAPPAPGQVQYNRDVRPILSENCFACHGADSASRKDDLRLDRFDDAIAKRDSGVGVIVPGKPEASEFIVRIESTDDPMPPEKSHKVLTETQKVTLRRWVAEGAKYEAHWAFASPVRPSVPAVATSEWTRNAIDNFILKGLENRKLNPALEADRHTLIRRVTLDLTGLPPTPAEVTSFMADTSPDAYGKLVDRLLSSQRWGEHRGRYWLDVARYADTHGIHFDNFREIWVYRDWVIKALNRNMPFDQFSREQLAGDLLPGASLEQKIASGFNRCNITTNEGGAIDEEYLVLYARDRTETVSQAWMGLTTGCAVCHDHKFDPISQKDFYAMSAFFNNTTQKAMDGNVSDTAPSIVVPDPSDRNYHEMLTRKMGDTRARLTARQLAAESDLNTWLNKTTQPDLAKKTPQNDLVAHFPMIKKGDGRTLDAVLDGKPVRLPFEKDLVWKGGKLSDEAFVVQAETTPSLPEVGDFERGQGFSYATWINVTSSRDGAVFARMDDEHEYRGWDLWLEKGRPGAHIIHKWPGDALKVVARNALPRYSWSHVAVTYDGSSQFGGLKIYIDGELQEVELQADTLRNTIRATVPFKIGQRFKTSPVQDTLLQDIRIYQRTLSPEEVRAVAHGPRLAHLVTLHHTPDKPTPAAGADARAKVLTEQREELRRRWLILFDNEYRTLGDELALLGIAESAVRNRGTVAHVMSERAAPAEAFVLARGEYDKRKDRVVPNTPAALIPMASNSPRNRIGLANWLFDPQHPLTARVAVNRAWQELFGTGLVRTAGDFGTSGELPANQELLDWLAVEFQSGGWDLKQLYRTLVTSATYRQAAVTTPEKLATDPDNRLLSRGPRFRMDAEMVRDYALAASGLMVDKIGGPSVKPYQPDDVWEAVAMPESNTRKYQRDAGDNLYRRSMYTFWKRAAPPAAMEIFNAPSRETCTVRRERTNTPLQALATLNDEQMLEAARRMAENVMKSGEAPANWIADMAMLVLTRPLKPQESRILMGSFQKLQSHYASHRTDARAVIDIGESTADTTLDRVALAALTMIGNQLLNLDEAVNK